jgi:putative DNA primase/helicase
MSKPAFNCTDLGNADRFIHRYGGRVRYLEETGTWLLWNGSRWKPVKHGRIFERARETVILIHVEAKDAEDRAASRELSRWAITLRSD